MIDTHGSSLDYWTEYVDRVAAMRNEDIATRTAPVIKDILLTDDELSAIDATVDDYNSDAFLARFWNV